MGSYSRISQTARKEINRDLGGDGSKMTTVSKFYKKSARHRKTILAIMCTHAWFHDGQVTDPRTDQILRDRTGPCFYRLHFLISVDNAILDILLTFKIEVGTTDHAVMDVDDLIDLSGFGGLDP